jgi:hypothetical protein
MIRALLGYFQTPDAETDSEVFHQQWRASGQEQNQPPKSREYNEHPKQFEGYTREGTNQRTTRKGTNLTNTNLTCDGDCREA